MGGRARQHVLRRYSAGRLLSDVDTLYRGLLQPVPAGHPLRT
jgi:hypothetical protein